MNLVPTRTVHVDEAGSELVELHAPLVDLTAAGVHLHCRGTLVAPGDRLAVDFAFGGTQFSLFARATLVHDSVSSSSQLVEAPFEGLDAVTRARLVHTIIREQLRRIGHGAA